MLSSTTDPFRAKIAFVFPSPRLMLALINDLIAGKIWNPCAGGGILKGGFACNVCKADGGRSESCYDTAAELAAKRGKTIDDVAFIVTTYRTDEENIINPFCSYTYLPTNSDVTRFTCG
jgi:hypothetical protein